MQDDCIAVAFISRVKTRWDIDLAELRKEISNIAKNFLDRNTRVHRAGPEI